MLKQTIKVGNSAGVLLPRKYLGNLVEVNIRTLNEKEVKKQIWELVEPYLANIRGVYLVGSYARKEEKEDSDVDVVVIANKSLRLKREGYHIMCFEYGELKKELERNIISYYPMLLEAKVLLNEEVLKLLLKVPISKRNLGWHLKTSRSALRIVEAALKTEEKELIVNRAIIYSLVLRLRGVYLVDFILKKKKGSVGGLLRYSKKVKSIKKLYEVYREIKEKENVKVKGVSVGDMEEVYNFVRDKLERQRRKINGLKEKKKAVGKKD